MLESGITSAQYPRGAGEPERGADRLRGRGNDASEGPESEQARRLGHWGVYSEHARGRGPWLRHGMDELGHESAIDSSATEKMRVASSVTGSYTIDEWR